MLFDHLSLFSLISQQVYYVFSSRHINVYNLKDKDEVKDCLSTLESHCEYLYECSLRWLGYKLSCKNILIIDEEEQFEIETQAIMMPFRMFVELVEYRWMINNTLSENLEKQDLEWFKDKNLDFKIAKHLHNNDLTLYKLIEQLEID